MKNKAIA